MPGGLLLFVGLLDYFGVTGKSLEMKRLPHFVVCRADYFEQQVLPASD